MKQLTFSIIALFLIIGCKHSETETPEQGIEKKITLNENTGTEFDKDLAEALDADEYGMKIYVIAFLKKGPNRNLDSTAANALQRAHINNITRLAKDNKLVVAGPFIDDGDIRGIYIFDVKSVEDAKILTESDPAIKAGSLEMELHLWYGSAALMKVNEIHSKLAKEPI
jgi:uncharacterized protein YciI